MVVAQTGILCQRGPDRRCIAIGVLNTLQALLPRVATIYLVQRLIDLLDIVNLALSRRGFLWQLRLTSAMLYRQIGSLYSNLLGFPEMVRLVFWCAAVPLLHLGAPVAFPAPQAPALLYVQDFGLLSNPSAFEVLAKCVGDFIPAQRTEVALRTVCRAAYHRHHRLLQQQQSTSLLNHGSLQCARLQYVSMTFRTCPSPRFRFALRVPKFFTIAHIREHVFRYLGENSFANPTTLTTISSRCTRGPFECGPPLSGCDECSFAFACLATLAMIPVFERELRFSPHTRPQIRTEPSVFQPGDRILVANPTAAKCRLDLIALNAIHLIEACPVAVIAGGAVLAAVAANGPNIDRTDLDVFILRCDVDALVQLCGSLVGFFGEGRCVITVSRSIVNVVVTKRTRTVHGTLKRQSRTFQLILTQHRHAAAVVENFDHSYIMCLYSASFGFRCCRMWQEAVESQCVTLTGRNPLLTYRLQKCLRKGFAIARDLVSVSARKFRITLRRIRVCQIGVTLGNVRSPIEEQSFDPRVHLSYRPYLHQDGYRRVSHVPLPYLALVFPGTPLRAAY
jgi:hypothetical protein